MLIRFFHFLQRSRLRSHPNRAGAGRTERRSQKPENGQVLVIFALSAVVLILLAGLAIDAGAIYVTYSQLKRAVDSAAIAGANTFKRHTTTETPAQRLALIEAAAEEILALHNIDPSVIDVKICDMDDPLNGADPGLPASFRGCPLLPPPVGVPRKLVWVEATQPAPLYFLHMVGLSAIDLTSSSTAEAAPLDLIIVIDRSESMASETTGYAQGNYDPSGCNGLNTCQPMAFAKTAASNLVDTLFPGYDRVAVVTFDTQANRNLDLSNDLTLATTAIGNITVHDDFERVWVSWWNTKALNPVNPEDRDGNGVDGDTLAYSCDSTPLDGNPINWADDYLLDRWWCAISDGGCVDVPAYDDTGAVDPYDTWLGVPCDQDGLFDSADWNGNANDDAEVQAWLCTSLGLSAGCTLPAGAGYQLSPLSTCSGCGMKEASEIFNASPRAGAVQIIVFLSDGAVNLGDHDEDPNAFCNGGFEGRLWRNFCRDPWFDPAVPASRDCNTAVAGCAPGASSATPEDYSPLDYALDQVDLSALTTILNPNPPSIFVVGLGDAGRKYTGVFPDDPPPADVPLGEYFLRYMAAVGDDGNRATDLCSGVGYVPVGSPANYYYSCGNYYFTKQGAGLARAFDEIAKRIYSRISE